MFIEYPWKSGVYCKSAENPGSLLGLGVNCLVLAEGSQLKAEIYQRYLLRAVNRAGGNVINNTTPKGFNWQYDAFYVPGQVEIDGAPNPLYNPLHWSTIRSVLDNPEYSREDFEYARRTLPREIFEEQYLGRFTHFSGLVYKDFINKPGQSGSHVVTPYRIPREWVRIIGYDAGANHATAILFGAIKPPRTLVIYDEIHTRGLGISEYAGLIGVKLNQFGYDIRPYAVFIDPSAKQLAIDLSLLGVYATKAENAVIPGVARVTSAIRLGELEVFSTCEKTIWEAEHYVWDEEKNKPLKDKDDAMDALRYMYTYPFPGVETPRIETSWDNLPAPEKRIWSAHHKRMEELAERERYQEEAYVASFSPYEEYS